jgi:short-subunit dehydrogenase
MPGNLAHSPGYAIVIRLAMSSMQPVTLITGASSGIGAELARVFAAHGHVLALTARRKDQLETLANAIAASGKPRPQVIAADLGSADGGAELAAALETRGLEPATLVNVAGFGLMGNAAEIDRASQLAMIDLNARALTDLSLRFLDSVRRHRGGILNVASIAAFVPGPGLAVYHATKAYVLSLTEALHQELKAEGVRVCALCPGPVPTEFFARAGLPADYFPAILARPLKRVAREGYDGFMAGHRVAVPGSAPRFFTLLPRLLPRGLMLAMSSTLRRRTRRR